jgi:hypothetical protein
MSRPSLSVVSVNLASLGCVDNIYMMSAPAVSRSTIAAGI